MHTLEVLTPFQYSVQANIDGHLVDYLLTVDETGQVHDAQALILELPAISQKLILGEMNAWLERKIRAYTSLCKFLLPLTLAGKLPTYQTQFAPLIEEIKQRLQQKGLQWDELFAAMLPRSMASEVLNVYGKKGVDTTHLKTCWEKVIYIIEHLQTGYR